ncbi:MAG: type II toxin-antitoxin system RelE/ParE family toxin [Acidobacteria bacterium]|nr:type II toxin-antitoxin system RelE/ParE family toxin [Acidobacteriota bacterium]
MKIVYADGVFEELVNISLYLAQANEDIAQKFLNSCDETFRFLLLNREVGYSRKFRDSAITGVRTWPVKGFARYLVFYQRTASGIRILHIVHTSTDYFDHFDIEK